MAQRGAGPPDDGSTNPALVPQAHVDLRTVTLPVVDGKRVRFTRLSTEEGLSQTRVIQIVQDDQGFMWFGSQYGLNRYDGYKFKVFKHEPGNPNSLSGVFISSLFKDRTGALWIGCDEFLDKFDPVKETFTHYRINTEDQRGETVPVTHISEGHTGMLWLSTLRGLFRLDPSTGRTMRYRHDPNNRFSLSSDEVKQTGEDRKGKFWVASSEGLDMFDRTTEKVTLHVPLRERGEMSFYEDRSGVFWIVHVTGGGMATFDRNTNTLTHYSFHKGNLSDAIPTGARAILEDRDGTVWFATMGDGLLKFDPNGRKFIRYRNDPADPESLAENDMSTLFEDREGNIWAGLHMMAPNHFSTRPPLFEKFKNEPGNPNSLNGTMVNGIYEDREGILWISAIDALNRVDRKTGQYTFYRTAGPGVSPRPLDIVQDRSGFLWIGSDGHGLTRFDPKTGLFKTFRHNPTDQSTLGNDIVNQLFIDHAGRLWATTFDGLASFDPATSHFTVYKRNPTSPAQIDIAVKEDPQGTLWIGTHSAGLQAFDSATGHFTAIYKHDGNDPASLSDNRVNSVYFDHSGTMWVGTQDGLDRFDQKTGRFKTYYEQDGLSGNVVSCLLEDERGNLWMSTNNGLSVFDPSERKFKSYSVADGLPGADLTGWGSCSKSPSGEMFFGGFRGAIAFYPDKVIDSPYVPPVVLTDFRIFGRPVIVGTGSPLSKSIGYASTLSLTHDQNVFSVEFSALSYFNPSTNRYRYMLDGLDSQWHEVGSDQRSLTYTTLPAGGYTLHVQGATRRGPWSEPGVRLEIEILPPLWRTAWFEALCGALVLALVWGLHRFRLHQMAREFHAHLEGRVDERLRVARELHDTLLQSFHGVLPRLQAVHKLLPARIVEAKEILNTTIDDAAQAITEARDAVQNLRSSTVAANDLAVAVQTLGEDLAAHQTATNGNAATFSVEVEGAPQDVHPILRDEIYRITSEAMRNAFRHARARRIEVEIWYSARDFRVRVRDDGAGIEPGVLGQEGREGHFGLAGMRERAEQMGGKLELWSELGAGTEVELRLPASVTYGHKPGRRSIFARNAATRR